MAENYKYGRGKKKAKTFCLALWEAFQIVENLKMKHWKYFCVCSFILLISMF